MSRCPRALLSITSLTAAVACSGSNGDSATSAIANVTLTAVPSEAACARITATADRTVTQDFAVTPGTTSLVLPNVPTGSVQFYASAFPDPCPVAANAVPTWITSAPATRDVFAGTTVDVTLDLARNPRACASTTTARAVTSAIDIPLQPSDSAFDLDGDGTKENHYANLTSTVSAQGFDSQGSMSSAIAGGSGILIFEETSSDPTLTADSTCASMSLVDAVDQPAPDFSGKGHFTADPAAPEALLSGRIQGGVFDTSAPPLAAAPPVIDVRLPFVGALTKVPLSVLRVSLTNESGGITQGQLNGVIKANDVQTIVIPSIATSLNASVQANPSSSTSKAILTLFDKGNCSNNGTPALVDGVISLCEVAGSDVITKLLAPDLTIFDANGTYSPSPAAAVKDAFSVGFHFTAVPAAL